MPTRYQVLPAVRGYKVFDDLEGRAVSVHARRAEALFEARTLAHAAHEEVELYDDEGELVPGHPSVRLYELGGEEWPELVDEPGMESTEDPELELEDELL
ncbi:MAG: hypothetical protein HYV09_01405 [Deltaproteobacteria bacterium]|nr:hypothetical protein [Deltaproteobacteria bacterium]